MEAPTCPPRSCVLAAKTACLALAASLAGACAAETAGEMTGSPGALPGDLAGLSPRQPGSEATPAVTPSDPPSTGSMVDGIAGSAAPLDTLGETPDDGTSTPTPDPGGGTATSCTGRLGAPGTNMRSVMNGALSRTFIVHVPATLDPNTPAPILFAHHGFTMSGQVMKDLTGFTAVADREGFIAVFPDGGGPAPWNVGTGVCGAGAVVGGVEDDLGLLDKMIESVAADQCVDRDRVFVTGFSMGGYFSNHVGCQKAGVVRAVAPHSGGTYAGDCVGGPIPVLLLHGASDGLIAPMCGTQARDFWVQRNGCSTEFDMVPVAGGHCEQHKDCPVGGQVTLCMFDGMAHGWAGADQAGATGFYGGGTQYESATELVWKFFTEQSR